MTHTPESNLATIDLMGIMNAASEDLQAGGQAAVAQDFRKATLHLSKASQRLSVVVQKMTRRDIVQTENIRILKERVDYLERQASIRETINTRKI